MFLPTPFPLTVFPEGGLAGSVITTVWIGVLVMCFFNLRFGWVLSGLVVPGYLVPLLVVKPFAALVIGVEAVLTYAIVWAFSERLAPGRFPALFGRDRFMGLILASVAVRLAFDGYLLPELSDWLEARHYAIDWENNLQSFGLVVISLMANQFWKPGLGRGLVMAAVTIGLTYAIVRFGLMELTNFRISGVYYLYEGLSSSILASPKAYFILVLTALIASHYNVKYGWDFSGILIPALIALQWYQPVKILTSFGEAIIIYAAARAVLRMPFMANVTLEGGRKLLLFFNISFAWKMVLGWFVIWQGWEVKTSDFFGFGYLLSTLIAIKAHDKDIFPRLARSTLQVSLAGAVMGNVAGFTLSAATTRLVGSEPVLDEAGPGTGTGSEQLDRLVVEAVGDAHVRRMRGASEPLSPTATTALMRLIEMIERDRPTTLAPFDQSHAGWRVVRTDTQLAIVRADGAGRELVLFDPAARHDRAVILSDPAAAPGLIGAGRAVRTNQQARWLVVGEAQGDVATAFMRASKAAKIVVAHGPASRIVPGGQARHIDLAGLRDLEPGLALSLDPAGSTGDHASLELTDNSLRAFDTGAVTALPGSQTCTLSRMPADHPGLSSLEQLAFVRFEIAAPLVRDVRQGEQPRIAAEAARLAGLDVARCTIGGKPHWSLSSQVRDEGNIFLAEGQAPQKALLTFENARGAMPAKIGADIYRAWGGDALFVHTRSDSFLREPHTVFDTVWQEWVRSQDGVADPMTFQLRARPREAVGYAGDVKVLVAKDRIGPDRAGFSELMAAVDRADYPSQIVTNAPHQAGVEARPGMSMRYLASAGNGMNERRYAFGWLLFSGLGERAGGAATR